MNSRLIPFLLFISLSFLLFGCPQQSPMKMELDVSPDPLVGEKVYAIIHIRSLEEALNTTLEFTTSEGIEVLTETTEFHLELTNKQWVEYKIPFRVIEEGPHIISAYAFNAYESGSEFGFGAGKTLYIKSTYEEGVVSKSNFDD